MTVFESDLAAVGLSPPHVVVEDTNTAVVHVRVESIDHADSVVANRAP